MGGHLKHNHVSVGKWKLIFSSETVAAMVSVSAGDVGTMEECVTDEAEKGCLEAMVAEVFQEGADDPNRQPFDAEDGIV